MVQIETNQRTNAAKPHSVVGLKTLSRERLFKMKIAGFLGQVRINFYAFCIRASKMFGLEKMKRGGKRISI